ncbi:hypothetical protein N9L47_01800 [Rhodobacteraceae bacterium]|nr:hypothetical protein [Paracoccaceae bacterium]
MSETLKSRTARASLFLLRENLSDLRRYAADPDPDSIDRLIKTAELTSTTIKKLMAWLSDEPTNEVRKASGPKVDPSTLLRALRAINTGNTCPDCGFVKSPDNYNEYSEAAVQAEAFRQRRSASSPANQTQIPSKFREPDGA